MRSWKVQLALALAGLAALAVATAYGQDLLRYPLEYMRAQAAKPKIACRRLPPVDDDEPTWPELGLDHRAPNPTSRPVSEAVDYRDFVAQEPAAQELPPPANASASEV